jgi:prepilin-type N-terminal cleavage/methylation domain-containing protein
MKKFNTKRKGTNKGFSLIEVLCAIVLLGLIAAPLIQMIYSSYATNIKSKRYLAAADLCQTVMEALSAQTYENSETPGTSITVDGVGNYYFGTSQLGVKNVYSVANSTSTIIPSGRVYECNGTAFDGTNDVVYFDQISYAGYSFCVEIDVTEDGLYSGGNSINKYTSVPVTVKVYERKDENSAVQFTSGNLGSFKCIQTASTRIPNKR